MSEEKNYDAAIVDLTITMKLDNGEVLEVDMDNEVKKILTTVIFNFFGKNIPFKD